MAPNFYVRYVKRLLDIVFSLVMLILLFPLLALVAVAVRLDSPGPALIWQERLGKDGRPFRFLKFRSMCVGAENMGHGPFSPKGDPRVTRVGRVLRAWSVDELPQLWNTLRGDMSIVGFRPLLAHQPWPFEEYSEEQRVMFALRPGITGWAQVNGRRTISFEKRIELSCWYAQNAGFALDVRILVKTLWVVLRHRDEAEDGDGEYDAERGMS